MVEVPIHYPHTLQARGVAEGQTTRLDLICSKPQISLYVRKARLNAEGKFMSEGKLAHPSSRYEDLP